MYSVQISDLYVFSGLTILAIFDLHNKGKTWPQHTQTTQKSMWSSKTPPVSSKGRYPTVAAKERYPTCSPCALMCEACWLSMLSYCSFVPVNNIERLVWPQHPRTRGWQENKCHCCARVHVPNLQDLSLCTINSTFRGMCCLLLLGIIKNKIEYDMKWGIQSIYAF